MKSVMVRHNLTTDTTRRPSPNIWADCPVLDLIENPERGLYFWDDFQNFPKHSTAQQVQKYASYIDTGVTIQQIATDRYGVLQIAGDDADNDEGSITTGGNTGGLAVIGDSGAEGKLWFEARIAKSTIADNGKAFFVGLAEEGLAGADTLVNDTGAFADKDCFGFRVLQDNGEEVDLVWKKAGQTVQEVANIATMAADTYIKLGFIFDPSAPTTKRIRLFINNVEYTTYITGTNIAAATFPDGEELALLLATKVGTGSLTTTFNMDWWRLAQLYV